MTVATETGTRGLRERIGKPDVIPNMVIEKIITLVQENDVEVLQFRQQGHEERVDGIHGRFQVRPEQIGGIIQELFDLKQVFREMNFEATLYPVGITDAPSINVEVRAGTTLR